jgi:hypothetical protein
MNDKLDTTSPEAIAAHYGLPVHNGTYHILAVLRELEEDKTLALVGKATDSCNMEYETVVSVEGLASADMVASFGLRYGIFILLLSSLYKEDAGIDSEIHQPNIEELKALLQRGARNLAQMSLAAAKEQGNG